MRTASGVAGFRVSYSGMVDVKKNPLRGEIAMVCERPLRGTSTILRQGINNGRD